VGVLPYVLGAVAAREIAGVFRPDTFAMGTLAVVLVMLAAYYAGEYWDVAEDALSARDGARPFSGGSQVVQRGLLPRRAPLAAALASVLLALGVSLILAFGCRTGSWTVPFAILGLVGGFFYSAPPLRWIARGWGEVWIALCYGWLTVAFGYYLQGGAMPPFVGWMTVPIGLTIFNVILLNEFPDYPADRAAGKANLAVRMGRKRASRLYGLVSLSGVMAVLLSIRQGAPREALYIHLPVLLLSLILAVQVLRGRWQERAALDRLCAGTIAVNLGTTAAYILGFWAVGLHG